MGDVFKQQYKRRDGSRGESSKWYGEYTNAKRKRVRVPLFKDKKASQYRLRELERNAERQMAGVRDQFTESADERLVNLEGETEPALLDVYLADLKLGGCGERYTHEVDLLLRNKILPACKFETVADIEAKPLDAYLRSMGDDVAARTKAKHRQITLSFANWLVRKGKIEKNVLEQTTEPKGPEEYERRALTVPELRALVAAAMTRPLDEAKLIRWGPRKGEPSAKISERYRKTLELRGQNNALLYRTAFYTGLRADELRSLIVSDLSLDENPRLKLPGTETKNADEANLPLQVRLAADLGQWVKRTGRKRTDKLFEVSKLTAAMLQKDLVAAGIPVKDERGRVADFHSLRKSLSTHLGKSGADSNTRKKAMRHSTIVLTMDTYDDEVMHDVRSAVESLPDV